jgi:WD40-like Beta Propeller Repeat
MRRVTMAALLALLTLAAACQGEEAPSDPAAGQEREREQEETPTEHPSGTLIYAEGKMLKSWDLEAGTGRRIAKLPSRDVAVSPDGSSYVAVRKASSRGSGGGRNDVLVVGSMDGGKAEKLGPGRTPVWSPDGTRVAVVATAPRAYLCEQGAEISARKVGPGCVPAEFIYTYEPGGDNDGVPEGAGSGPARKWVLLGWTRGNSIIGSSGKNSTIISLDRPGERKVIAFHRREILGASPTDNLLLIIKGNKVRMGAPGEGAAQRVDFGDVVPTDGMWSPDGTRIATPIVSKSNESSRKLALVAAESGEVVEVPGSEGAQGSVAWLSGGESFVYSRAAPANPRRNQAVHCTVELECEPLFLHKKSGSMLAISP